MKKYLSWVLLILTIFLISCQADIKVTYVLENGENNIVIDQKEGLAQKINTPIKEDYEFVGWTKDGIIFDFEEKINEDIVLTALWKQVVFQISFEENGGSEVDDFKTGEKINLPDDPVKKNCIFKGWYLDSDFETIYNDNYIIEKDITLYALWEEVIEASKPEVEYPRSENITYKDITYKIVNGNELKMDLYLPSVSESDKSPALFFYFGGGWIMGDKRDIISFGGDLVDQLVKQGIAVVCVNYRLCTDQVTYPSPVEDCLDAIRYVVKWKDAIGIDVNNMGSIGYSAGGHLATMAAFAQDHFKSDPTLSDYDFKLKYVIDMFGPAHYDKSFVSEISVIGQYMLNAYIGPLGTTGLVDCSQAFPSYYLSENNPNVLIIHGEEDSLVPVKQSLILYDMMKEKNIDVELLLVEGAEHVLTPATGFDKVTPSFPEILEKILDYVIKQTSN